MRTTTLLSTGLGNDHVTVDLDAGEDGYFVLNTQGPYDEFLMEPLADAAGVTTTSAATVNGLAIEFRDDDVVDGSASSLPLIVFGGRSDDVITGGTAGDILIGDRGEIVFKAADGTVVATLGDAIIGDFTDGFVTEFSSSNYQQIVAFSQNLNGVIR